MSSDNQKETQVLIKLMKEQKVHQGWNITTEISEIPNAIGHYALYDGLNDRGGGVTLRMRSSIEQSTWFKSLKRAIFMWMPDSDGSAALWLEGKVRCNRCTAIIDIGDRENGKHHCSAARTNEGGMPKDVPFERQV